MNADADQEMGESCDDTCTVGGVTGAGSKMMRSIGKGVTTLSANKQFERQRRRSFARPADNVQEGFARAGRRLVVVSIVFHCH